MKQIFSYRALKSLYTVTKQLRMKGLITALASGAEFSQLIKPPGTRPLILSAHPGDEIMAMGGAMAWYAEAKIPMTVLTFTAGMHGTNTGKLNRKLGPRRKKEQIASYKVLEAEIAAQSWELEENFAVDQELIFRLIEFIDEFNPDIIYVPSLLDNHRDSQSINTMLVGALDRLPTVRTKTLWVAQYELWTPLIPNKILSINDYQGVKENAIKCHESQLLCRNYLDAMVGLNRYRAAILGAGNYAEAFFMSTAQQYTQFFATKPVPVLEQL